jgi:hypothetical protein
VRQRYNVERLALETRDSETALAHRASAVVSSVRPFKGECANVVTRRLFDSG